ncbi:thermonuclease family protein [Allomesorhizobium alhagi]|uniref:Nuclease (SNase-like) protein n=1 Tax=Mesorhizobium alhagi CCNWXJ12-2 TaxID=1107882 RepID=H0HM86_9HYPH|nr:nuclease (SNase-like) protein [Mesorhizobium alhagi]EHK58171.1 nuclease (SNase-like) protein [Mesorhizobium alhagi CCNWXJ12-2]
MIEVISALLISCWPIVVTDGDTIKCNGQLMRLLGDGIADVSGVDTPELRKYRCERERIGALRAKKRLNELVAIPGTTIEHSGAVDDSGRPLVRIRLPDGRTAESVLLEEGYALDWSPNHRNDWCYD